MKTLLPVLFLSVVLALAPEPALAGGDPARGEKVFKKCMACHSIKKGGEHKEGPNLFRIMGRAAATAEGFAYSASALKAAETIGFWDASKIDAYLKDPRRYLKLKAGEGEAHNKMSFSLPKAQDRANVIAFLETRK